MPPLAPRPFSQMARRDVRLYGNTLQGLRGAVSAAPWYRRQRRRRAVITPNRTLARHVCESRAWKARMRSMRPRLARAA